MDEDSTLPIGHRSPLHPSMWRHEPKDLKLTDARGKHVFVSYRPRFNDRPLVKIRMSLMAVELSLDDAEKLADALVAIMDQEPGHRHRTYYDADRRRSRVIQAFGLTQADQRFVNLRIEQHDARLTDANALAVVEVIRLYLRIAQSKGHLPYRPASRLTVVPSGLN